MWRFRKLHRQFFDGMPIDVFDEWLLPLIRSHGWPFNNPDACALEIQLADQAAGTKFYKILLGHEFGYWRNLQWNLVRKPIEEVVLDKQNQEITHAIMCHVLGYPGIEVPTEDIDERFKRASDFIRHHNRTPASVVAVIDHYPAWRIADGHHRIAAAFVESQKNTVEVQAWIGSVR